MLLDPVKIAQKIAELKIEYPGSDWLVAEGMHALTGFQIVNNQPSFNPQFGIPVKIFMNTKNMEIKIFPASIFEVK